MRYLYLIIFTLFGSTSVFSQNFGVSLENTMWTGDMIRYIYDDGVNVGENTNTKNSIILGLDYTQNITDNLDMVSSVGYGLGFKIIPLKANLHYTISNKISANIGMGIYMVSDTMYDHNSVGKLEDNERADPSTNEFGMNFGMSYNLNSNIALTGNYNMLKNGDYDFQGISFGLSYNFGVKKENHSNKSVEIPNESKHKQPTIIDNSSAIYEKHEKEQKELLEKLKQANSEISTQSIAVNKLSSTLDSKEKELKLAQDQLKITEKNSITLEVKQYHGEQWPVFNTYSFSSAFRIAANKYGSSEEQKFWWNGNVFTTEKK
jgi:hypothetical protein